ncbi:MAG: transposase [bacterium]|nr:transposase [bacterium]
MPRQPRIDAPGVLFHVINRGNGRQAVFRTKGDRVEYLELIERFKERHPVLLYHYVLMSNHVHFLLEAETPGAIAGFMHDVTLAHTVRTNHRRKSVGHVWQGRYKAIPIETDEHFLQCGRYIELNPVRAKMVQHPKEYPWSSYDVYAAGSARTIVDIHPLYEDLGARPATRQRHYRDVMEMELLATQQNKALRFSEKQAYGTPAFFDRLESKYDFKMLRERVGRPRNGT